MELGFNFRMTDIQAAVGLVQLGKLDQLIARRRLLAQRYQQLLAEIPGVRTITDPAYGTTNYQSFWVLLPDDFPVSRDELLQQLARAASLPGGASWPPISSPRTRFHAGPASGDRAADSPDADPAAVP